MTKHAKKIIAPVIIVVVVIAYCAAFFLWPFGLAALVSESETELFPFVVMILFILAPVAVVFGSIYVLIERIKEINKGEEDDLSKY